MSKSLLPLPGLSIRPADLVASARGRVWSLTTDAATAARLQKTNQISALIAQGGAVTARTVGAVRPDPSATLVEPTFEDAYLLAVS